LLPKAGLSIREKDAVFKFYAMFQILLKGFVGFEELKLLSFFFSAPRNIIHKKLKLSSTK